MSIFSMSTMIKKKVEETTTSANIAFLPGGFSTVQAALSMLARKKKKWGIKILGDELKEQYHVVFEDGLTVRVNTNDWMSFHGRFLTKVKEEDGVYSVDLEEVLQEAQEDEKRALFKELESTLYGLLVQKPVSTIDIDVSKWLKIFGLGVFRTGSNVLLKYESLEKDMKQLLKDLEVVYADDRGALEMIIAAIKQRRPLNMFSVFDRYEFLIGSNIQSKFGGQVLGFEGVVDMFFVPQETITVEDSEVMDVMDAYPDVKVVNKQLFPKGKTFGKSVFKVLKDEVETLA